MAPSSSWAWEHPRARQQPWVRRPSSPQQGRERQRRARGQPARGPREAFAGMQRSQVKKMSETEPKREQTAKLPGQSSKS